MRKKAGVKQLNGLTLETLEDLTDFAGIKPDLIGKEPAERKIILRKAVISHLNLKEDSHYDKRVENCRTEQPAT